MTFNVGDVLISLDGEISTVVEKTKPMDSDRPYRIEYRLKVIKSGDGGLNAKEDESYWADSRDINRYYKKLDNSHTASILFGKNGKPKV